MKKEKLGYYECEGQLSIFDFIGDTHVKLIQKNEYEDWRCNGCGAKCPPRVIYGSWPYEGIRVPKRCPGCNRIIDIPEDLQKIADYVNNYCTDNVSRCNRTEIWEKAAADCPKTCCHRCEIECQAKKELVCKYTYNVCNFSKHTCNKKNLWEIADTLDETQCPHVCCRKCNTMLCGVRCNGSEEPKAKALPVDIRGICDDAFCPICHYPLDDLDPIELDCEQCPECGTRLDWSPWHRINGK